MEALNFTVDRFITGDNSQAANHKVQCVFCWGIQQIEYVEA